MPEPSGSAIVHLDPGQWKKLKDRKITFSAVAPATLETGLAEPGMRLVSGVGVLDLTGRGRLGFKGGFRLQDTAGAFVEVTDPSGMLPRGSATCLVRTSADGGGTRMELFDYSLDVTKIHVSPLSAAFGIDEAVAKVNPVLAKVLTDLFGEGAGTAGTTFAQGSVDFGFMGATP
ncbi:hypothetical protein [Streptomyces sp. TBY4]|uniref:hypothetical protein n=1 Tax=Streptomyces sp. TBY4 TaxID=2962030 RepID=UPI0020B6C992|nr:hypothetical protein [Streptomyces sp. TBY4]MCP3757025.1 hypothetical protein [Streptomyces sp. TBY4]